MLELIKNSMRATVDFHGLDEMDNNPIRVVIADGEGNEVGSGFGSFRTAWKETCSQFRFLRRRVRISP